MNDSPERRNKIAAITTNYWRGRIIQDAVTVPAGRRAILPADHTITILDAIVKALGGETDIAALSIDPDSTPALQIQYLIGDDR